MNTKALMEAVFFKELALLKRYWLNSLISVISIILLFTLLFLGYSGLAGGTKDYANGLMQLLTGYILTILALFFFQDIAQNLSTEAAEGVLEILYMSPFGYLRVCGARLFISFFWNILMIGGVSAILILITGQPFHADLSVLLPMMLLFLVPMIGLSFALGGLQLIFKKLDSMMGLLQYLLAAFVALPVDGAFFWTRLLPGVLPAYLARQIASGGYTRASLPSDALIQTILVSAVYLIAGLCIFLLCEKKAKKDGHLAHY